MQRIRVRLRYRARQLAMSAYLRVQVQGILTRFPFDIRVEIRTLVSQ